jgi:hypothetical protein
MAKLCYKTISNYLSDPTGKGYLEKPGFYVALKMVALSQSNQDLNSNSLTTDAPPPNLVCLYNSIN